METMESMTNTTNENQNPDYWVAQYEYLGEDSGTDVVVEVHPTHHDAEQEVAQAVQDQVDGDEGWDYKKLDSNTWKITIEGRWRARYLTWIDGRADEAPSGHLLAADVWDVVERPSGFLPPLSIGIDRRLDEANTTKTEIYTVHASRPLQSTNRLVLATLSGIEAAEILDSELESFDLFGQWEHPMTEGHSPETIRGWVAACGGNSERVDPETAWRSGTALGWIEVHR
eukprot:g14889.t1